MTTAQPRMKLLSDEQIRVLRSRFPYQLPSEWAARLAAHDGWRAANTIYLNAERKRASSGMRHLMAEVGVDRVRSREEALELFELAFRTFASSDDFTGRIERQPEGALRIEVERCPVYEALEAADWRGVTACPSWYRRRGWLDAMGVQATDSLLGEKKWGDSACVSEIQVQRVR
jgi:hypothetical protein